jgi:hypothetical protein
MISLSDIKKKANPGYKIRGQVLDYGLSLKRDEIFEKFMESYSVYYNITRYDDAGAAASDNSSAEGDTTGADSEAKAAGFDAEAVFDSKGEQYFLIKAAKVAEMNTAEYVYFKKLKKLSADVLKELDTKAWELGISHVNPSPGHKNTDAVLIVVADSIDEDARTFIKSIKHSKNYKFALHGYSNYRLVAIEASEGKAYFNRQACILMGLVGNILVRKS